MSDQGTLVEWGAAVGVTIATAVSGVIAAVRMIPRKATNGYKIVNGGNLVTKTDLDVLRRELESMARDVVTKHDLSESRREIESDSKEDRYRLHQAVEGMIGGLKLDINRMDENITEFAKNIGDRMGKIEVEQAVQKREMEIAARRRH